MKSKKMLKQFFGMVQFYATYLFLGCNDFYIVALGCIVTMDYNAAMVEESASSFLFGF